jgi:hypothetical protein
LCGVVNYASAQGFDFLKLEQKFSFLDWKHWRSTQRHRQKIVDSPGDSRFQVSASSLAAPISHFVARNLQ